MLNAISSKWTSFNNSEKNMANRIVYKGYIIISSPHKLHGGGFSSNGCIEQHTGADVRDHILFDLQSVPFGTEKEADDYYIEQTKKKIDQ